MADSISCACVACLQIQAKNSVMQSTTTTYSISQQSISQSINQGRVTILHDDWQSDDGLQTDLFFLYIQTTIYRDIQNEDPQIYVLKQL